ncbi:MAG TPA: PEGA domain-containing protein [Candidatus Methylacidiphilales bacterium]|nr:PEGA domain-containing protein [Candidatus Methylacidiphilales bacterium]
MAIADCIIALDDLDRDYRGTWRDMESPAAFALDQAKLVEQQELLASRRAEMKMAFTKLKHALATARGTQLQTELHTFLQIHGMPAADALSEWLSNDWNVLLNELPGLQAVYEQTAAHVEKLVHGLVAKFNRDDELVHRALALSEAGEFTEAQRNLQMVSRLFKGIPYPAVEAATARLPLLIKSHSVTFDAEKHRIISKLNEWGEQPGIRYKGDEAAQLTAAIQKIDEPAQKSLTDNSGVREGGEFHSRMSALMEGMAAWKVEALAQLEAVRVKAGQQRKLALISAASAIAVVSLLLVWFVTYSTGYRYTNPSGAVIEHRYVLPGSYTVEESVPAYHPYKKTFDVSLLSVTDLGVIDKAVMTRETGRVELDVRPANAEIWLQGEGDLVKEFQQARGRLVVDKAPAGDYKVVYQAGTYKIEEKLKVENNKTAKVDKVLPVGNLAVSSTPPGAIVLVNGRPQGDTPLTVESLDPGEVTVTLKFGDVEVPSKVKIVAGEVATLSHDFPFGSVTIESDPTGAEVRFTSSGMDGGKTPFKINNVLAKPYEVELTYPGLEPKKATVTVKPGDTKATFPVTFDYGKIAVKTEPEGGLVMFKDQVLPPAKSPYRQEYVRPGTYGIIARFGPATVKQDITVSGGGKESAMTIPFPCGSARVEAEPEGVGIVINDTNFRTETAPLEVKELPAGQYIVTFLFGTMEKRMPLVVKEKETTTVKARFLAGWVEKQNLPVTDMKFFANEGVLTPGKGMPSAVIGGPVDAAVKKFGRPDRIMSLDDAVVGKVETLIYNEAGISISSDGLVITSITAAPGIRPRTAAVPATANTPSQPIPQGEEVGPWLKTNKGISLGATMDDVLAKHGAPSKRTPNGLTYSGISFLFNAPRGGVMTLRSIRVEAGAAEVATPPAGDKPKATGKQR